MNDQRFCRIAGFLAEHGVHTLILRSEAGERVLQARQTDLPAELDRLQQSGGELAIPELDAAIRFVGSEVRWTSTSVSLQTEFLRALTAP